MISLAWFMAGGLLGALVMALLAASGREEAVREARDRGYRAGFKMGRSALRRIEESVGDALDGDEDSELGIVPSGSTNEREARNA